MSIHAFSSLFVVETAYYNIFLYLMHEAYSTFSSCRILKVIASLLSPTAFALGSVNFADYERAHVGLRWSNIWQVYSIQRVCASV